MKYFLVILYSLLFFCASQNAYAKVPATDTLYADSIFNGAANGAIDVTNPLSALNMPDNKVAKLSGGVLLDLCFRNHAHNAVVSIKKDSTILIWGQKDKSVDSSAGQAVLYKTDPDGALLYISKPYILEDGLTTIIPDRDYTYIELSVFVDPGPKQFAKSYLVDAVALIQDTMFHVGVSEPNAIVSSFRSYPNPFISKTTIRFTLEQEGETELIVSDALGREISRIASGYQTAGMHELPLEMKTPGFYFVRLLVNGQPVGAPLKINSE